MLHGVVFTPDITYGCFRLSCVGSVGSIDTQSDWPSARRLRAGRHRWPPAAGRPAAGWGRGAHGPNGLQISIFPVGGQRDLPSAPLPSSRCRALGAHGQFRPDKQFIRYWGV